MTINYEMKRGFSLKNKSFEYFRLKFFDFFPMNSWITDIADEAGDLIKEYLAKGIEVLESDGSLKEMLWDFVGDICQQKEHETLHGKIAKEFFERYRSELYEKKNDKLFRKLT